MRNTWTRGATGAALVAVLAGGGCYDFDEAASECEAAGRCETGDGGTVRPDGGDAGDAGDAGDGGGCVPTGVPDLPDDAFADTDCDGVDGQADAGFFIDPTADEATADGTREHPYRTLSEALQHLRETGDGGTVTLFLARGRYDEADLRVDVQASLYGGYSGLEGSWRGARDSFTVIDGGTVGLTVSRLPRSGAVLERLHVISAAGRTSGQPSVALRVEGSTGVLLHTVILEANRGGDGYPGTDAPLTENLDGVNGGDAGYSAENDFPGLGGTGATRICPEGPAPSGGSGRTGSVGRAGDEGGAGVPATPGGAGGNTGIVVPSGTPKLYGCDAGSGQDGAPGADGGAGDAGIAGDNLGELASGMWQVRQNGTNGARGRSGAGGGGGGGGGSCVIDAGSAAGGGSGGGGSGGCGGPPGTGGGSGGASIALLLDEATVTVDGNSELRTRGGGNGGRGGDGAPGGRGGRGGKGSMGAAGLGGMGVRSENGAGDVFLSFGGDGGTGGNGGSGGSGGAGGGGGGGPTIGIWCGTETTVNVAEATVSYGLADGGAGGASEGNPGSPGVRQRLYGCN